MGDDSRETHRRSEDRVLITDFHELADTVLGTRMSVLKGGGRLDDGLVHDMRDVKADVATTRSDVAKILEANGDVKLKPSHKVLLWSAAIGGVASILSAFVLANMGY